jgi:hypothetical protein
MLDGVDGWGVMTTEHFTPQDEDPRKINEYSNCYLCCSHCNYKRGKSPIDHPDGNLLNPCKEAWSEHFRLSEEFELELLDPEDRDAQRTCKVYYLNAPVKVVRRKARHRAMLEAWSLYRRNLNLFRRLDRNHPRFAEMLQICKEQRATARNSLKLWGAIPNDRPDPCSCEAEEACCLPQWLDDRCENLPSDRNGSSQSDRTP